MTIDEAEWKVLCSAMNAYVLSDAIAAGCELGLFTYLAKHPDSAAAAIAEGLSLSPHGTRSLLLACSVAELVSRDPQSGTYANTAVAGHFLVEGTPNCVTSFVRFVQVVQRPGNASLARAVKEGRNTGLEEIPGAGTTLYERLASRPELERLFHEAMGAYSRLAPKVVDAEGAAGAKHLLDIGGGDGSVAIELCRKHPQLRVTLMDKPTVCPIATAAIERASLADRIRCVPGDIFRDAWPRGHDAVLLSHLVEIFSPERVRSLYRAAHESMPAGGKCIVWTIVAQDDEAGGLQAAKSSLYFLAVASGEGMAYPVLEHEQWLRDAGFTSVTANRFPAFDHAAIVATK